MAYLVLIETAGNQRYIYSTNRLREVVGASEVIFSCGIDLVLAAAGYSNDEITNARKPGGLRAIFAAQPKNGIEVLLATSGKALIRVEREETGRRFVSKVTLRALREKPGVTVRGAMVEITGDGPEDLHRAIADVHKRLASLQARLPSNDLRFQRLPVVAECTSSGLPASRVDGSAPSEAMGIVSQVVWEKRQHRENGWKRLTGYFADMEDRFDRNIDDLEQRMQSRDARWIAIVHADGNGLGQIFLDFLDRCKAHSADEYIKQYRTFSLAIEECTLAAAEKAVAQIWGNSSNIGCIPVVLGGDDLTVICEGDKAVPFAQCYLEAFEHETGNNEAIKKVLGGDRCIAACAGIAIVKPHFPFHRAYELAEDLTTSAKTVKQRVKKHGKTAPCSALHYHVHFDSSGADFDNIQEHQDVAGNGILTVQPWVVSTQTECDTGKDWIEKRQISYLWQGIETLSRKLDEDGDSKSALPRSQQHALRDGLFQGVQIAQGKFATIQSRYEHVWPDLLPQTCGRDLFFNEDSNQLTPLLDMMDLADLGARQPKADMVEEAAA